nr:SEC-C domain-containing protein [Bradyrhizobium zhanjiangense]
MLAEVEERLPKSDQHHRIFRHNRALAMFKLGAYDLTLQETERLGEEYYDLLGLSPEQVIGRNPPAIRPLLPKGRDNRDDLKHLADTLDLHAQALQRSGRSSPFARIHAMKFYELAHAPQSVIRVGQDLVDDFCIHYDFESARDVIEKTLLPTVQALNLVSWVVPVRSQYAVVLAYSGKFDAADNEMRRLAPYEAGLSPAGKGELQDQRRLITRLRRSGPPPQRKVVIPPAMQKLLAARNGPAAPPQQRRTKVGRNERCPCQSGRKYKHCHGR